MEKMSQRFSFLLASPALCETSHFLQLEHVFHQAERRSLLEIEGLLLLRVTLCSNSACMKESQDGKQNEPLVLRSRADVGTF